MLGAARKGKETRARPHQNRIRWIVLGLSQWEGDMVASQLSIIGLAERRSEAKTRPKPSGRSQT